MLLTRVTHDAASYIQQLSKYQNIIYTKYQINIPLSYLLTILPLNGCSDYSNSHRMCDLWNNRYWKAAKAFKCLNHALRHWETESMMEFSLLLSEPIAVSINRRTGQVAHDCNAQSNSSPTTTAEKFSRKSPNCPAWLYHPSTSRK